MCSVDKPCPSRVCLPLSARCFYLKSFLMPLSIRHMGVGGPTPEQEEGWDRLLPVLLAPVPKLSTQLRKKKTREAIKYFKKQTHG